MKYIFLKLPEIKKRIENSKHTALLLDFDGTISPIVKRPENAYITEKVRHTLQKINKIFPVIIVTGRPLSVIRRKVGVRGFIYAASHGLEWSFDGKFRRKLIPKTVKEQLNQIRNKIWNIKNKYQSLIIEKKPYSVTFHYHLMPTKQKESFIRWLKKFLRPFYRQPSIRVFHDKETVEIIPSLNWTKGDIAKLSLKYLSQKKQKKFMPIYVGDSTTDEDAFRMLSKGITIRVGKNENSAAKWYMRDQKEVGLFLKWLLSLK